ncbi:MAG: hypothetical protein JNM34_06175 [Chthonomonadaceae bacterium]|nr:hypothetical protein [Chthonomonadaceae bacterium]
MAGHSSGPAMSLPARLAVVVAAVCLLFETALAYGRPDWTTFANNTKEVYGYDSLGRMGSLTLKNSSNSVLRSQSYAYRADGRISSHTLDGTATTFDYDEEGQILTETKGSVVSSYTYDGNYNRLTKAVTGQPTETYSYDDADRLLSVASSAGTKGFTYDNDGRCTSETWNSNVVKTYSWDPDGRMTSATGSWGTRSYAYNGFGARVAETGGEGRQWFRRGPSVTAPVLKDGVNRYTPGTSLRALAGGTSTFQHGGLKSLDAQTDASQAVSGTKTYDAFGATASSTGSWQGQSGFGGGFGYQSDSDTGLQLLGHRYYDPTTGRFLSRDPAKDGPNWYAYCLNDPVNGADPSGLWEFYRWMTTGDGNADDIVYEKSLVQLDASLSNWWGHFCDRNRQFWLEVLGGTGAGTVPGWSAPKPEKWRMDGGREKSSVARRISVQMQRSGSPVLKRIGKSLVRPVADEVKRLSTRFAAGGSLAGGLAVFLWIEAGIAWVAAGDTMNDPLLEVEL